MSKELSHDWNYAGNGIYECRLCGYRNATSFIPQLKPLNSEICVVKENRKNSKLPPFIRRAIETSK